MANLFPSIRMKKSTPKKMWFQNPFQGKRGKKWQSLNPTKTNNNNNPTNNNTTETEVNEDECWRMVDSVPVEASAANKQGQQDQDPFQKSFGIESSSPPLANNEKQKEGNNYDDKDQDSVATATSSTRSNNNENCWNFERTHHAQQQLQQVMTTKKSSSSCPLSENETKDNEEEEMMMSTSFQVNCNNNNNNGGGEDTPTFTVEGIITNTTTKNLYNLGHESPDDTLYGYGEASPDEKDDDYRKYYGYNEDVRNNGDNDKPKKDSFCAPGGSRGVNSFISSPQNTSPCKRIMTNAAEYYGYGEAAPDSKDTTNHNDHHDALQRPKTPRRSSMKQTNNGPQQQQHRPRRRNSIGIVAEIEVRLPGKKEPVKRRTSISFQETAHVKTVEPISSLVDNPEQLWFQEEEYHRIQSKIKALVEKAAQQQGEQEQKDNHNSNDNENKSPKNNNGRSKVPFKKYCIRGLERMMAPDATAIKKNQALDTVLNEQYLQRYEGGFNEEHMANLYKFTTMRSRMEATKRATQDAREVETYLKGERRKYRRMSM